MSAVPPPQCNVVNVERSLLYLVQHALQQPVKQHAIQLREFFDNQSIFVYVSAVDEKFLFTFAVPLASQKLEVRISGTPYVFWYYLAKLLDCYSDLKPRCDTLSDERWFGAEVGHKELAIPSDDGNPEVEFTKCIVMSSVLRARFDPRYYSSFWIEKHFRAVRDTMRYFRGIIGDPSRLDIYSLIYLGRLCETPDDVLLSMRWGRIDVTRGEMIEKLEYPMGFLLSMERLLRFKGNYGYQCSPKIRLPGLYWCYDQEVCDVRKRCDREGVEFDSVMMANERLRRNLGKYFDDYIFDETDVTLVN